MIHRTVEAIANCLKGYRYRFSNEDELQQGVAAALEAEAVSHSREAILSPSDRADFLVDSIAIEVKVDGSLAALTRQIHRYLLLPNVAGAVVVTSRSYHRGLPAGLNNKPIRVVWVGGVF